MRQGMPARDLVNPYSISSTPGSPVQSCRSARSKGSRSAKDPAPQRCSGVKTMTRSHRAVPVQPCWRDTWRHFQRDGHCGQGGRKTDPLHFHPSKDCQLDGEPGEIRVKGRHDISAIPRIIPVCEAMVLLVLADFMLHPRWAGNRTQPVL